MTEIPSIFVHGSAPRLERLLAWFAGSGAATLRDFAQRLDDRDLESFPLAELSESEEHNAVLLEAERMLPEWRSALSRAAAGVGADASRLELICRQRFLLTLGRRLTQIRELLAVTGRGPVTLATDLPQELVARLKTEERWGAARIRVLGFASALLRAHSFLAEMFRVIALHAAATIRICQLAALPHRPAGAAGTYAAWIGAEPAEMHDLGPRSFSLLEFLAEALQGQTVSEIVVQGARPAVPLPNGLLYRRARFSMRWRPPLLKIAKALLAQLWLLASDLSRVFDWRHRQIIAPITAALPGTRLWFESDRPQAVLYPNSTIGVEPAATLLGREYAVETMMVFYSANVAHWVKPTMARPAGDLEPEIRCIAADRIAMWSREMHSAFLAAGYPANRLPVTGVVHYGKQTGFIPSTSFASRARPDPIRLGIFDVSMLLPARRFLAGWGQTFYHPGNRDRFFGDLLEEARILWGDKFVVVRKLKRRLNPGLHADDIELEKIVPPDRIVAPAPETSLWTVLAEVDLVVCMPFTSVSFMADHYGIPAAYYDPSGKVDRSSLAGRAPLLSSRDALRAWLKNPKTNSGYDPGIVVARETLRAACGGTWREPRLLTGKT